MWEWKGVWRRAAGALGRDWLQAVPVDVRHVVCTHIYIYINIYKKYAKSREIGIPNNSRISVFTIYLANLVYWVGFVTGITFTVHL